MMALRFSPALSLSVLFSFACRLAFLSIQPALQHMAPHGDCLSLSPNLPGEEEGLIGQVLTPCSANCGFGGQDHVV